MLGKFLFTTIPGSIFLAAILISTSILIAGDKFKANEQNGKDNINTVLNAQEIAVPSQSPIEPSRPPIEEVRQDVAQNPNEVQENNLVKVDISNSPILGDKNAELVLIEFSDYECPYCKRVFTDLLPELKTNYINKGKLKLVYKNLPLSFHANAFKEAEAALCARDQGGDEAYYKYHDQIFTKTASGGTGISLEQLPLFAETLNLDIAQFQKCLDTDKFKAQVNKEVEDAAKAGASGTPTWIIGKATSGKIVEGVKIVGAQPFSSFQKIIEQELSK